MYRKILILLLVSVFNVYADVNITNKENYVNKIRNEEEIENNLAILFDNIIKNNNKYVKSRLNILENTDLIKANKEKEKSSKEYGPASFLVLNNEINEKNLIDINTRDKKGYTPLIIAIIYKNNEIVDLLLKNNVNIYTEHPGFGKLSLHTAVFYENEEAVKMILEKYPEIVNVQSQNDGFTALQEAVLKNNVNLVKYLLSKGANPMIKDYKNGSAMDMATEFGKGEIVKVLRDKIKEMKSLKK